MTKTWVTARDGTPLAAQVVDDREAIGVPSTRPTLLIVNGLGATIVTWRFLIARLRAHFRIVSFDPRGTHESGRPVGGAAALDVDAHANDVVDVAHALGSADVHAAGWSMGVQVLIEAAPRLPELRSLVLHNGVAGRTFDGLPGVNLVGPSGSVVVDRVLAGLQKQSRSLEWLVARLTDEPAFLRALIAIGLVHPGIDRPTFNAAADGFRALDAEVFCTTLRHLGQHDAWHLLPQIDVPTLVVAGTHDHMTPLSSMQRMVAALPRGELHLLPHGTHYAALEMPDAFVDAVVDFYARAGLLPPAPMTQPLDSTADSNHTGAADG